jgi:hypothetical protein
MSYKARCCIQASKQASKQPTNQATHQIKKKKKTILKQPRMPLML